ncbi:MAG TPA: flagellar biosynthesis anti-sigma factor FlgM [Rudaea sp.]
MAKIDANLPVNVPSALPAARRAGGTPVGAADAAAAVKGARDTAPLRPASTEPPLDTSKVAQLRAAVLDGSYRIDASRIADRLVGLEKKLP